MTYKYNSELSNDDSKLQDSIFWKRKEQFALLMENFVVEKYGRRCHIHKRSETSQKLSI